MATSKSSTTSKKTTARKTTRTTRKPAGAAKVTKVARATTAAAQTATTGPSTSTTPKADIPEPMVVSETKPVLSAPSLRKKALIEAVTARSGIKRKDVKPTIEAMLAVLGEAIAEGRDINLPDLGKFKITRSKKLANGEVFTVRIRQPKAKPAETPDTPKDPLAEAAE